MEEIMTSKDDVVLNEDIIEDTKLMMEIKDEDVLPSYKKLIDEVRKCQDIPPNIINIDKMQGMLVQTCSKMMNDTAKTAIEVEIQNASIKRQQFIKEKELIEEILKATEMVLEAEMKLALARLDAGCETAIEIERSKVEIKRQVFLKEKELIEEILKATETILEAEMKLALTRLDAGCDLSYSHSYYGMDINATDRRDSRVNVFSNASAPPEILLESNVEPPTNNLNSEPSSSYGAGGLEQLVLLDTVKITLVASKGVDEIYHVMAPDGSVVFRADLTLGWMIQISARTRTTLQGELFDNQNQEVVKFRPFKTREMEVQVGKEKKCILKRQSTFGKHVVTVNDIFDHALLKIKGQGVDGKKAVFAIQTARKMRIGCINKELDSTSQKDFDGCSINFPRDLDICCKSAIIICSFLIVTKEHAKMRKRRMQNALLQSTVCY